MARIYQPLEIIRDGKPSGLYHMVCTYDEDDETYAAGPCARGCPGHTSKAEAVRHWREGNLESALLCLTYEDHQKRCIICDEWTQLFANIRGDTYAEFTLCAAHNTIDNLRKLYLDEPPGQEGEK